jgi:hypothetical protein
LARNPDFIVAIKFLANNDLGGYVSPGFNKLWTTLLQHEKKTNIERLLAPFKITWHTKGVITTDGWSDAQRHPCINFIAVTEDDPMFLRAINTEGDIKRGICCRRIDGHN